MKTRAASALERLRLESPVHGGPVAAHSGDGTVMVYYGLPGELADVDVYGRRRGVAFGRAVNVIEASDQRTPAPCPYFGSCGGCAWQHARYDYQLQLKLEAVAEVWRRAGVRLPPVQVIGMEDPWRYRVRGEFEGTVQDGQFHFGFHRLRSYTVLPVEQCPIHDARIERVMLAFRDVLREAQETDVHALQLTVEPTGNGILWSLRRRSAGQPLAPDLVARVQDRVADVALLDDSMSLEFWGLRFRVRNDTFIQTNYRQMLRLYEVALEMLAIEPSHAVLDLYSGIGTISLPVARGARRVTGIESNAAAVNLAQLAARINSVENVRFSAAPVESALAAVRLGEYQLALLDPPRAGCAPAALAQLIRLGFERLVYVSCEPSTQARDVAALVRGGYRVRRAALVDMFPQTYHVESVVLLER